MEDMECGLCRQDYDDNVKHGPFIIPGCGHTVCATCAKKLFENKTITCPFDRKITHFIEEDVIKCLKPNYKILEAITEKKKELKKYEKEYEKEIALGIPCAENEAHISVLYCTVCRAHYCKRCLIILHSSKSQSTHKIVKVTEKPEPLLFCPLHEYSVAELYCQEKGCKSENKVMCTNCHLYGVHKGHEYKTIDEIFEEKKKEALDLLNTTNIKKDEIRSHIDTIGEIPDDVENDEEYVDVKNHIEETYNKVLTVLDNWKKSNLDMLKKGVEEKIKRRRKEKENYDSQLEELDTLEKKCLNMTKKRKAEYFEKSADCLTAVKKWDSIDVSKPSKLIELKPLVQSLDSYLSSFCESASDPVTVAKKVDSIEVHNNSKDIEFPPLVQSPDSYLSSFFETNESIRKIVFVAHSYDLQYYREEIKKLAGFKEVKNDVLRMEDQQGNPYYIHLMDKEVFKTSPINIYPPNTIFYMDWFNESLIEKLKELPNDATIIISDWVRRCLMWPWNENERNMMRQISAPIFSCDYDKNKMYMKEIAKGNYVNNPFFKRWN